jgi:Glycosyltransferase family 87
MSNLSAALRRIVTIVGLVVLPIAAIVMMFVVGLTSGPLAGDFHHELYPEAKLLLRGENPFPPPEQEIGGANFVWPPLSAYLISPLTLAPAGVADVLMIGIGLVCFAVSLWLIGVRDWRIYGVVALWPEFLSEMRVSHLTPVIALLLAAAWRWRDERGVPGLTVGLAVAVKFFVWPVGVWLAATRRFTAAVIAAFVTAASLTLILPHIGLDEYADLLLRLGRTFDQDSYSVHALLVQAGGSEAIARGVTFVAGGALLVATWRYRSFTLAVAAALVLSPIVWLDYFALVALPLALARPRLSPIWFLPLATWGLEGAGKSIGDVSDILRLLVVFAIVVAVAFRGEPDRLRSGTRAAT